jgi:hypothetical protein
MSNNKKNTNQVTVNKVVKNSDKALAVFGGMAAGKLLSHFLDKAITSSPVQGLIGIEISQNLSKYVKPLIVTGTGMTTFVMSKNQHIKYAGIGAAGIGMSELVNAVTGKDALAGMNGFNGLGSDNVEIIDLDTGMAIPPAPALNLPELSGRIGSDMILDEEDYSEEESDYADMELDAA